MNGTYRSKVIKKFSRNRMALISLVFIVLIVLVAVFADFIANNKPLILKYQGEYYFPILKRYPALADKEIKALVAEELEKGDFAIFPPVPYSPVEIDLDTILSPPTEDHLFGSDDRGRDVLARMIHGTRTSLLFALTVTFFNCLIGVIFGSLMGYYGGRFDLFMSRVVEIVELFPVFFLQLTLLAILPPSLLIVMAVYIATGWVGVVRYIRGQFLALRNMEFVTAVKAMGGSDRRVIFQTVLPNAAGPLLVLIPFMISSAILGLSALSFLGFGEPIPTASWGELLSQANRHFSYAPWLAVFPGCMLFLTLVFFNMVGEAVRDALDPKT